MIDVGMCQQNIINLVDGYRDILIHVDIFALLQTTVHKDMFSTRFQIVTASGDLMVCAYKT